MKKITDLGKIIQSIFEDASHVIKTANAGIAVSNAGVALNAALRIGENQPIMIFNSSGSVQYVAFGVSGLSAPSAPTDGIPVKAGDIVFLNSGSYAWVRASAASVYGYVVTKD